MTHEASAGSVTVETFGHILLIGINRPSKRNGLTPEMLAALAKSYQRLEDEPDLRVGVLYGHGTDFCAGLDLPRFREAFAAGDVFMSDEGQPDIFARRPPWRQKPLIAAVKGVTFTAGLELALAADVVVAATDARLAMLEPSRGLMPVGGATYRFIQRGGWGNAMRWLLTGEEFGADEAQRIGLVQEIVPPGFELNRAIAIAEAIAAQAPLAVAAIRANALTYVQSGEAACVAEFGDVARRLAATADFAEGIASFQEKREAVFTGH
ncbi:crotonase/enoyl-CoA hydratase family protein [Pedomonas mirosovicensis]|uniref:crotonase/enoyl-CoA hydratase family protein n=1 Tax=Pedomonas mirosovicensis TaxID=2908641 RepID=UPI0021694B3F|nr:crotonase/enoyl-CoA hydratase family protein [Pedomonas mirosovicensis]MCH8686147.1 crotonase/enoyl-CoA hydratase family protein [Pedomonas mirosovicensis]